MRFFGRGKRTNGFFHCKRCSKRVLSRQQFISELADKHSIRVDPQTLEFIISGAFFGGWETVEDRKREMQSIFTKVENDRGVKCNGCGKIYCYDCVINFARPHPITGGKACFSCGGSFSEL